MASSIEYQVQSEKGLSEGHTTQAPLNYGVEG